MEIPEAADELSDALLLPRGDRAAVQLRPRLPRPGAAAEESGSESGNSESSLGPQSPEQSVTGDDSDNDSDDDANNPGFELNTGHDTDLGSGREPPSRGRADQPRERQAPPDMPQDQAGVIEALQLGGEQPNDMMRHKHGWNPTPRPEYDVSSGAQVPLSHEFWRAKKRGRYCGHSNGLISKYYRRKRSVGTEPPGGVASVPPSNNTPPMERDFSRTAAQLIGSIDSSVVSSHMSVPQVTSNAALPEQLFSRYSHGDELHVFNTSPSFDFTRPSQPGYQLSETSNLFDRSWYELRLAESEPASSAPSQSYETPVFHNNLGVPEPSSFEHSSISGAASAPIFNPPASTSLVQDVRPVAKSPDELAAEQFIRQLVLVQLPDGRFSFSDDNSVKATLGLPFLCLVTSMRRKLNSFDPAVTIAIVTLLEEQFHGCQDLWVLMVRKASDYITGCNLGAVVEELQQEARKGVRSMGSVLKELKDGEVATEAVTELERAPIS